MRSTGSSATSNPFGRCRTGTPTSVVQLYDQGDAGRGYTTEAVQLLVDYLFDTEPRHRIHLVVLPDNGASRRIAEKCGFTLEGTIRDPFYHRGRNVDVVMYSLLRTDPRPWRDGGAAEAATAL
jgi:L-amino acid N-acyltransferase YncA